MGLVPSQELLGSCFLSLLPTLGGVHSPQGNPQQSPARTLSSDFQPPDCGNRFLLSVSHPAYSTSLWQPKWTRHYLKCGNFKKPYKHIILQHGNKCQQKEPQDAGGALTGGQGVGRLLWAVLL